MRNEWLLALFLAGAVAAATAQDTPAKSATIQGSGCVEAAVESSCLVLKDAKTGDAFNLLFEGKRPGAGAAIWFKGTEHQGMTTCMQGKAVNVTKWKRAKGIKCPPAPAKESSH